MKFHQFCVILPLFLICFVNMAEENRRKLIQTEMGKVYMRKVFFIFLTTVLLGSTVSFASCTANEDNAASQYEQATFIPQPPDYNDAAMWVTSTAANPGSTASVWRRTSKSGPRSGGNCTSRLYEQGKNHSHSSDGL